MSVPGKASTDVLKVDREGNTLWLTLNRPDAHNSITPGLISSISSALDLVDADRTIRAVAFSGSGRAFCTGGDLKAILIESQHDDATVALRKFLEDVRVVYDRIERLRVPTIAAVNGLTLAGGLELMMCCDMALADENAKFGDGHAKFAQIPGAGASVRMPRRIGLSRAKYLMYTGDLLSPQQALEWGLVDEVVPAGQLRTHVDNLFAKIVDKSPLVLERMKGLLQDGLELGQDGALRGEIMLSEWHSQSFDRNEGIAAFVEKRPPVYRGQ